jgi:Transcription elongation factor, GreA/GreB, C-term
MARPEFVSLENPLATNMLGESASVEIQVRQDCAPYDSKFKIAELGGKARDEPARRDDGRVQKYRIVGEDEADPKAGSISFASPVARLLMGKAVGDQVGAPGQNLQIISIS